MSNEYYYMPCYPIDPSDSLPKVVFTKGIPESEESFEQRRMICESAVEQQLSIKAINKQIGLAFDRVVRNVFMNRTIRKLRKSRSKK